jgi:uncharacterized protein YvpB
MFERIDIVLYPSHWPVKGFNRWWDSYNQLILNSQGHATIKLIHLSAESFQDWSMGKTIIRKGMALLFILLGPATCNYATLETGNGLAFAEPPTLTQRSTPLSSPTLTMPPTPFQPLPASTRTPIPSPTASPTSTPTITLTQTATFTPTQTIPAETILWNFRGHRQYLSIDCEAAAAADWASFFGKNVNELNFQNKLPHSDNPDYGFVGYVNAPWGQIPPYSYGVHAGPVADLLNDYGVSARAYKGYTMDQIKAKIAEGKPVIAWVIGNVVSGNAVNYTDSKGHVAVVAVYEHVIVVMGYTPNLVYYMSEGIIYSIPTRLFQRSWQVLGNMVVVDR